MMPQRRLFPRSATPHPVFCVVLRLIEIPPSPHFSPKSTPVRLAAFWSNRCQQTLFYVHALSNDIRVNAIKANRLLREQSGGSCCIPMETTQRERLPTTLHLMTYLHPQQSEKPPQIHNRAVVNYFNTNPLDVTLK